MLNKTNLIAGLKSLLKDAGTVALFVGGWITLDGIAYAVPVETALGVSIVLLAGVLRFIAKAVK